MSRQKKLTLLFLAALLLPTIVFAVGYKWIDHENYENRTYAEMPEFSLKNYAHISEELEAYYNDRVPFKNQLKQIQSTYSRYAQRFDSPNMLLRHHGLVTYGVDNWLFYTPNENNETVIPDYAGKTTYSNEELQALAAKYQQLQDFYEERGIYLVIEVAPDKMPVYDEYLPDYYPERGETMRAGEMVKYIRENTSVRICYPLQEMLNNKPVCDLYFRTDSHWNEAGAYVGLRALVEMIPDKEIAPLEEAGPAEYATKKPLDLSKMAGFTGEKAKDKGYVLENFCPEVTVEEVERGLFESDAPDDRRVLLVGDSFSNAVAPLLARIFPRVRLVRDPGMVPEILDSGEEAPDILIFVCAERGRDKEEAWPDILMGIPVE